MTNSHSRRTFLQASVAGLTLAATRSISAQSSSLSAALPAKPGFSVVDYHVHLSDQLSLEQAVALGKERGVQIGIVEHPGPGFKINTDAELKNYIETLRPYPVRIGLQPVYPGWSKVFSKN